MNKIQTKIAVGIAVIIWLVVALLSNGPLPQVALKAFSVAGTMSMLLFLLYDRFIWKWNIARAFTGKPLIAGTWRGNLQSDFGRDGRGGDPLEIPLVVQVKQTNSNISLTLFTEESSSVTEFGQLAKEEDDRWSLAWVYQNTPRQNLDSGSFPHQGACKLYLSGQDGDTLRGHYFTNRKTAGEVVLLQWSKITFGAFEQAMSNSGFGKNKSLVRWF